MHSGLVSLMSAVGLSCTVAWVVAGLRKLFVCKVWVVSTPVLVAIFCTAAVSGCVLSLFYGSYDHVSSALAGCYGVLTLGWAVPALRRGGVFVIGPSFSDLKTTVLAIVQKRGWQGDPLVDGIKVSDPTGAVTTLHIDAFSDTNGLVHLSAQPPGGVHLQEIVQAIPTTLSLPVSSASGWVFIALSLLPLSWWINTDIAASPQLATPVQHQVDRMSIEEKRYAQMIEQSPSDFEAWATRSLARFKSGNYTGAIEDATQAISLDPSAQAWRAYIARGQSYHAIGEYKLSLEDYNKIVHLSQTSRWVHELSAYSYLARGKGEEAAMSLRQSLNNNFYPHVAFRLGMTLLLLGQTDEASATFNKLDGLWKDHALVVTDYLAGNIPVASKRLAELRVAHPQWAEAALLEYMLAIRSGAKPVFTPPPAPLQIWQQYWVQLGQGKISLQHALRSVEDVSGGANIRGRRAECFLLAGYLALGTGDKRQALEHFISTTQTAPLLTHAYLLARFESIRLDPDIEASRLAPTPMLVNPR